jgi:hypothetical protein
MSVEKVPEGDPGKLADMRAVVNDDIEPSGSGLRCDPVKECGIFLPPLINANSPGRVFDMQRRLQVESDNDPLGKIVPPEKKRSALSHAKLEQPDIPVKERSKYLFIISEIMDIDRLVRIVSRGVKSLYGHSLSSLT